MQYRKEIDGLRTIAVIPVIFFHAGFEIFSGGFVGVDVFFVISGYLITSILAEEIEQGRYSIVSFYERRARRILPALFFMMACSAPFALLWMLPYQLLDFSKSILAVLIFSSNILFWRESDYFSTSAEEKPLLHTWSLAVEEQYYLFFPLLLFLLWRTGRRNVMWILLGLSVCSLMLSEWGWRNQPTANFYLAPTRLWEMFTGSLAALHLRGNTIRPNQILSATGLAMIVASILFYDGTTPFPSFLALLPVLGTVAIILFTDGTSTWAGKLLATRPFVGIGLLSYSAYLWHQPLFAFARIRVSGEPSSAVFLTLSVATFGFAYLSWRYIERPFRARGDSALSQRHIFSLSLAGGAVFAIGAAAIFSIGGEVRPFTSDQKQLLALLKYDRSESYREGRCFLKPEQGPDAFTAECRASHTDYLIGDSHAAALSPGVREAWQNGITQFTASACPPVRGFSDSARPNCGQVNEFVFQQLSQTGADTVILHANWKQHANPSFFDAFGLTVAYLKGLGIAQVIVLGGVPQYLPSLPERMLAQGLTLDSPNGATADLDQILFADRQIRTETEANGGRFTSLVDLLCAGHTCAAAVPDGDTVTAIAWDYGHLTLAGARYATKIAAISFTGQDLVQ